MKLRFGFKIWIIREYVCKKKKRRNPNAVHFTKTAACLPSFFSRVWLFSMLWAVVHQTLGPWGFSSKNTGVDCHALLQGIFPVQGANRHLVRLPHWQAGSSPLSSPGKHLPQWRSGLNFFQNITYRPHAQHCARVTEIQRKHTIPCSLKDYNLIRKTSHTHMT